MATKIPFRTAFSERVIMHAPTGKKYEMRHRANMKADGRRELVKDKRVEIYEIIQSHAEECDINNIIRRATNGDPFALNKKISQYADLSEMPKTLAEAQQIVINLKEGFAELPTEIRAKFENNAEMYVAAYGTDDWLEKVGFKERMKQIQLQKDAEINFAENVKKAYANLAEGGQPNEQK